MPFLRLQISKCPQMPRPSRTCAFGASSKAVYHSLSACYLKAQPVYLFFQVSQLQYFNWGQSQILYFHNSSIVDAVKQQFQQFTVVPIVPMCYYDCKVLLIWLIQWFTMFDYDSKVLLIWVNSSFNWLNSSSKILLNG